jgi:hypothetical protein
MSREDEIDRAVRSLLPPKVFRVWGRKPADFYFGDIIDVLAPIIRRKFATQIIRD